MQHEQPCWERGQKRVAQPSPDTTPPPGFEKNPCHWAGKQGTQSSIITVCPPPCPAHQVPMGFSFSPMVLKPKFLSCSLAAGHFLSSLAWPPAPSPTGLPGSRTLCPSQHPMWSFKNMNLILSLTSSKPSRTCYCSVKPSLLRKSSRMGGWELMICKKCLNKVL